VSALSVEDRNALRSYYAERMTIDAMAVAFGIHRATATRRVEEHLYRQLEASSTTLISVSHRPSILKYHRQVLELVGNEAWRLCPAEGYAFHG
jgi:hypothetical protein